MKPTGAFQTISLIVRNVWQLCLLPLWMLVFWTLRFLSRLLIDISCLTLQCVRGMDALLRKTAGVIWRLQTGINRNSRRLHAPTKVANTSGM